MKNRVLLFALLAIVGLVSILSSADSTHAAFHLMRVYGVMGGAFGSTSIQYVELRMTDPGHNFVETQDICFYNSAGVPVARFTFGSDDAISSLDGGSILIGNAAFEAAYSATRDFGFTDLNGTTVTIPGGVSTNTPVVPGSGKVAFGSDSATMASLMCQGSFTAIYDSVAYGPDYPITDPSPPAPPYLSNYPPKFDPALPTAGTDIIRLTAAVCYSPGLGCPETRENGGMTGDYEIRDANSAGNEPRNFAGTAGTLTEPSDADSDGISDSIDNCPTTPNTGQENNVHTGTTMGDHCEDPDSDGDFDIADNCPDDANPLQEDGDTDTVGDACDNCPTMSNSAQTDTDADTYGNPCDNCPTTANPGQENNVHTGTTMGDHCEDPDSDGDFDIADNCPDDSNPTQADVDTDTYGDECDNCPLWSNPAQNMPVWPVPSGDDECDGYSMAEETTIGTDPLDNCPDNPSDDAWPPDIDKNKAINILDITQLTPPVFGTAGTPGSHPAIFPRLDLAPNGVMNILDLTKITPPVFGSVCT